MTIFFSTPKDKLPPGSWSNLVCVHCGHFEGSHVGDGAPEKGGCDPSLPLSPPGTTPRCGCDHFAARRP